MFRAVRCTTALLAVLAASACGTAPTAPTPARKSADPQAMMAVPDSVVPKARMQIDCDPETGQGCCYETLPWWC